MKSRSAGFALLEQITLITAFGLASVAAAPTLLDLHAEAETVAMASAAGSAHAAMVMNYAGCLVTNQVVVAGKCARITDCSQVRDLLQGDLPDGVSIAPLAIASAQTPANGAEARCTLTHERSGTRVTFTGLSAGN